MGTLFTHPIPHLGCMHLNRPDPPKTVLENYTDSGIQSSAPATRRRLYPVAAAQSLCPAFTFVIDACVRSHRNEPGRPAAGRAQASHGPRSQIAEPSARFSHTTARPSRVCPDQAGHSCSGGCE